MAARGGPEAAATVLVSCCLVGGKAVFASCAARSAARSRFQMRHTHTHTRLYAPMPLYEQAMEELGEPTLKPFLQDVIQLKPLVQTLTKQVLCLHE